ncbi:uncharacterized protein [Anabrus simplex]
MLPWRPQGAALEFLLDLGPIELVRTVAVEGDEPLLDSGEVEDGKWRCVDEACTPLHLTENLETKVLRLQIAAYEMRLHLAALHNEYQVAEQKVTSLIDQARQVRYNLHDVVYLEDLIFLLEGQLEHISLRCWPFKLARPAHRSRNINLIV